MCKSLMLGALAALLAACVVHAPRMAITGGFPRDHRGPATAPPPADEYAADRGRIGQSDEWVKMPDLAGLAPAEAARVLDGLGFDGHVAREVVPGCARGTVCRHIPAAGEPAMIHEDVTFYVTE